MSAAASDRVSEMIDARLTIADMMRIFNVKKSAYYQLQAIGKFDAFEIKPRIGPRLFSAKKVQAYLDGELQRESGAKGPRPVRVGPPRSA